jgi:thioredoxin reductase (NADPH)
MNNVFDLIIIGAGPAGYTSSIYASRYNLKHVVIGDTLGGMALSAHKICNYPSESEITGLELMKKMYENVKKNNGLVINDTVIDITKENDNFVVVTAEHKIYQSNTILFAIGTKRRKLDLKYEKKFLGRGISYCATCDAFFYKNRNVAVIGGSDSANTASLYLADIAKKVYQIYRKDKLKGERFWVDRVKENTKISVIYNTEVVGLIGKDFLSALELNNEYKGSNILKVDGLFIEIGSEPDTSLTKIAKLLTDNKGYIIVGQDQSTNIKGIWGAGDITTGSNGFRQIVTACAEGAIAVENIYKYCKL